MNKYQRAKLRIKRDKQRKAQHKIAKYQHSDNFDEVMYIWDNGGLLFDGMKWMFRLPDLYIKVGRYEDALNILDRIKKPIYADKVVAYREKIAKKMNK